MSFSEVMKSTKNGRRTHTVTICFSSEVDAEYRDLEVQLNDALAAEAEGSEAPRAGRRVAEGLQSVSIAEKMKALRDDNAASFYDLVLQALPREGDGGWLKLRSDHPPRDNEDADAGAFNSKTFPAPAVKASLLDPEPNDDVLAYLDENLTSGDWDRLAAAVWFLNEGSRQAPKLDQVSQILSGSVAG